VGEIQAGIIQMQQQAATLMETASWMLQYQTLAQTT